MNEQSKYAHLLVDVETKKDAMKAAFLDVQTAMYAFDALGEAVHTPAHMRTVLAKVAKFEGRVKEYITAEDAIVIALSDVPKSDITTTPADLTGEKQSNAEWAELPTAEESTGGSSPSTEG
jgi:hypothetical protein